MKKRKTPYWWAVIETARERQKAGAKPFTSQEVIRASSWVTCACGEQDDGIERMSDTGEPTDKRLLNLGLDFWTCVDAGLPDAAARVLRAIEVRAAELLAGKP